jgi:hypothetical protein
MDEKVLRSGICASGKVVLKQRAGVRERQGSPVVASHAVIRGEEQEEVSLLPEINAGRSIR